MFCGKAFRCYLIVFTLPTSLKSYNTSRVCLHFTGEYSLFRLEEMETTLSLFVVIINSLMNCFSFEYLDILLIMNMFVPNTFLMITNTILSLNSILPFCHQFILSCHLVHPWKSTLLLLPRNYSSSFVIFTLIIIIAILLSLLLLMTTIKYSHKSFLWNLYIADST